MFIFLEEYNTTKINYCNELVTLCEYKKNVSNRIYLKNCRFYLEICFIIKKQFSKTLKTYTSFLSYLFLAMK